MTDAAVHRHIVIVAWLYMLFGIVGMTFAAVVFVGLLGVGLEDGQTLGASIGMSSIGALFFLATTAPSLAGGIGLLKRKSWARVLVLGLSFLNLLNLPFGTALGAYAAWVLLKHEAAQYFPSPTDDAGEAHGVRP